MLLQVCGIGQTQDSVKSHLTFPTHFIQKSTAQKSKSKETIKPTIIKILKKELHQTIKVNDLIKQIPNDCNITSCEVTIKVGETTTEYTNFGNEIIYLNTRNNCKFICIENIVSECPTLHNANYKIIFQ